MIYEILCAGSLIARDTLPHRALSIAAQTSIANPTHRITVAVVQFGQSSRIVATLAAGELIPSTEEPR